MTCQLSNFYCYFCGLTLTHIILQEKPRLNEAILKKGRKKNRARNVAIYLARELTKERAKKS